QRTAAMLDVSEKLLASFSSRYLGTVRPVLIEHETHGKVGGFTDNYLRVELSEKRTDLANTVVPVRLVSLAPDASKFIGEIITQ
ncbi:MAG: tRNA (N(6)-L-threonylcarbamoyladenosine(37)-C(2))-methylthiotransferase MtaB, partial [Muribaculaceae bacterium]|nr:tRNA (N(6)-L-threonylcarbamoyladenosine(37)-C(2))-methylthiotransferase MtaB [Muribaculaceae bacterium]